MDSEQILRRVIFRPYRKGMGPVFRLVTWDTYRRDHLGKNLIGYRLTMSWAWGLPKTKRVLFQGEDFGCSPLHAIDSDAAVEALMGFLTLRPGDTDAEYFKDYTAEQRDYCEQHAEALACEVQARFCDENGNVIDR